MAHKLFDVEHLDVSKLIEKSLYIHSQLQAYDKRIYTLTCAMLVANMLENIGMSLERIRSELHDLNEGNNHEDGPLLAIAKSLAGDARNERLIDHVRDLGLSNIGEQLRDIFTLLKGG